jgi:hypothetical protein
MKPHRGSVILAFGILGLLVCQLFGLAAWLMADKDLQEMHRGYMDPSGRDLTKTGRILGMVGTGLMVTSLIIVAFFILIPLLMRAFD